MTPKQNKHLGVGTSRTDTGIVEAALSNDFETVASILEDYPEAVNEQNESGLSALMASAGRGHLRIVQLIASQPGVAWSLMDQFGRTALDHACAHQEVLDHIIHAQFGSIDLGKLELV